MASNEGEKGEHSQTSSLVDSLISGDREGVGGILCNDPSGLCLASKGSIDASNSGVYTSLVRLASQLKNKGEATDSSPLITIECDTSAILVKEYDGHTVALRVPSGNSSNAASRNGTSSS